MKNTWKDVWHRKGEAANVEGRLQLIDLLRADGFDSGGGDLDEQSYGDFVKKLISQFEINRDSSVFEIGCGAGAFLQTVKQNTGCKVAGIDFSHGLIKLASRAIPAGDFRVSEANQVPFANNSFSIVASFSVFQYFSSQRYASEVIKEMGRVLMPGGVAAIIDINDEAREGEYIKVRSEIIGAEAYAEKYNDFPHRFYRRKMIEDFASKAGLNVISIEDQEIDGYVNSRFRFNAYFRKNG